MHEALESSSTAKFVNGSFEIERYETGNRTLL